ncbi:putative molybdenum ABC-type transporter, permease subunit [Desulforapulum autotrophicum HRM2]|uniref:Molybdenum ABC-type transporter, permease subunit n=2 Tax=Desulforapulum autotrophicum TaxID=2296 RepID=C0QF95_DESAH|nr:putative molybdenum ABC-type transporter, permease subunit [Desulforapulum autotrophicum HRM2]
MGFQTLRRINYFRLSFILISQFITLLLVMAIISLFIVPDFTDIWENLWSDEMQFSLKLSMVTGFISTILVMIFALPIGYTLSRFDFMGKGFVKAIIDLPVAFPELVLGLCLLLLFGNSIISKWLEVIGLNFVFTKQGVVAAQFFTALPYASRIMKSTFDYIDPRLEFISRSLGYSMFETFLNVSLPLANKGILASTIISFARCIGTFGTVLILAGGSYMKTEVLPITLYLNISYGNMGMALTSGIVLMVVSFAAIYVFERAEANL